MTRINLYNYRYQEIYYKKLRFYLLLFTVILSSLCINVFIYFYYQVKIMYQETRNAFLIANLNILDERLKPINEYNSRLKFVTQQLDLLTKAEDLRDDMLAFCQQLNRITPAQVYFSQISWESQTVNFYGTATTPLYLANFLDKLREESGIFYNPVLKSNTAADSDHYNFTISASVKPDLMAESNGQK